MSSKKLFVLDTNIILNNYINILAFQEHDVALPIAVIEELDRKKKLQDDVGLNARKAIRLIDELCEFGNISEGIPLSNLRDTATGTLKVLMDIVDPKLEKQIEKKLKRVDYDYADNRILLSALQGGSNVVFVTKDINLRIKANALGLEVQSFRDMREEDKEEANDEVPVHVVRNSVVAQAYSNKELLLPEAQTYPTNSFHLVTGSNKYRAPMRLRGKSLHLLTTLDNRPVQGIAPRNLEQRMSLDLLLDPSVSLVTLRGKAGTGKTLLALAAALEQLERKKYKSILVARPTVAMGNDIGFLPGDKDEKLASWINPIYDNLKFIFGRDGKNPQKIISDLQGNGRLQLEAIAHIRGRSLPEMFIIIDEAQNLTPHEVKTIITRAGEGSKIVLCGDPNQIDLFSLSADYNGLVHAATRMKGLPLAGDVALHKSERSELAEAGAELL